MYLDEIIAHKQRVWSGDPASPTVTKRPNHGRFAAAVALPGMSVIAEVKPASPSKGQLLSTDDAVPVARKYAAYGARAVSVLAEDRFFGGSPELVKRVSTDRGVDVPVLYKDFVVDPRQVSLAANSGAAALLIIVRAVDDELLGELLKDAAEAGLDALVETFSEQDVERALSAGATIIGVNNRDLQDFSVDLDRGARIRESVPRGVLTVSESGIGTADDLRRVAEAGFDACLVGESLLRAADPGVALRTLLTGDPSRSQAGVAA
ncbi:indole-3-glycerol-phosphate synthase [Flexivirga meconopsidis]|uniref:indole-3-glycerol-phosphate synthase n=1 Tax=Flexivirga meconopsidis TaxID=2977121 RepID=UPI00223FA33E|nr:indole-3-glycerol-phosphate synthase [Flexivirga meconopsidis]